MAAEELHDQARATRDGADRNWASSDKLADAILEAQKAVRSSTQNALALEDSQLQTLLGENSVAGHLVGGLRALPGSTTGHRIDTRVTDEVDAMSTDYYHEEAYLLPYRDLLDRLPGQYRDRVSQQVERCCATYVQVKRRTETDMKRFRARTERNFMKKESFRFLFDCGFARGDFVYRVLRNTSRRDPYAEHTFELGIAYIKFLDEALVTISSEGRRTVIQPTAAYDNLCNLLDIPKIEKHEWIVICA